MITKNEEESLMEKAIGSKITDYLTKPVNPSQVLMACKKVLEQQRISSEHVSRNYQEEFQLFHNNFSTILKVTIGLKSTEISSLGNRVR
jgi:DNA-binding NarL/FixJ family response regulator